MSFTLCIFSRLSCDRIYAFSPSGKFILRRGRCKPHGFQFQVKIKFRDLVKNFGPFLKIMFNFPAHMRLSNVPRHLRYRITKVPYVFGIQTDTVEFSGWCDPQLCTFTVIIALLLPARSLTIQQHHAVVYLLSNHRSRCTIPRWRANAGGGRQLDPKALNNLRGNSSSR